MRVLFGLLCIVILSPAALWFAESQHKAADIQSAMQVSATAPAVNGYVVVSGTSSVAKPVACPKDTQITDTACIYSRTTVETFTESKETQCGSISSSQKILGPAPDQCTSGGSCSKCYYVASDAWQTTSDNRLYAPFVIGSYTVTPSKSTTFVGTTFVHTGVSDSATPNVGDVKTTMEYLPAAMAQTVVGESSHGMIDTGAAGKVFAVSSLDYAGTVQGLAQQDSQTMWLLRIVSLILMVIGFVLLTAPFEAVFTMFFRFIPIVGGIVNRGVSGVLHLLSGILGLLVWLVVFALVLAVKNILVVGVIMLIIAVLVLAVMKSNGAKLAPKKS